MSFFRTTFRSPSNIEESVERIEANLHQEKQKTTVLGLAILQIGIIGRCELFYEKLSITRGVRVFLNVAPGADHGRDKYCGH
jgi:hypothetical protein